MLADVYIQKPPHQYPFREPPQSLPKGKATVDDIDVRQVLAKPLTAAHPDVVEPGGAGRYVVFRVPMSPT